MNLICYWISYPFENSWTQGPWTKDQGDKKKIFSEEKFERHLRAGGQQGQCENGIFASTGPPANGPCSPAAHAGAVHCHGHPAVQPARATGAAEDLGGPRSPSPQPLNLVTQLEIQRKLISHSKLSTVIVDNPNYTFTKKIVLFLPMLSCEKSLVLSPQITVRQKVHIWQRWSWNCKSAWEK